jgi:hypothetical protein
MKRSSILFAASLAAFTSITAVAQDYPAKPSPSWSHTRQAATTTCAPASSPCRCRKRSASRSSPTTVRAPAATSVTALVSRAPPDGYTLGIGAMGPLAVNSALYPNMGFDPEKDLVPVI